MLRITSAQINPTIGDFSGNIALMLKAARQARDEQAHMVVFPEMYLTAYYPGDLLDDEGFQARLSAALINLKLASRETPRAVLGRRRHRARNRPWKTVSKCLAGAQKWRGRPAVRQTVTAHTPVRQA